MTLLLNNTALTPDFDNQTGPAPAATAIDAKKVYGRDVVAVRALDGVTVEFDRGQCTAIMGPSGSGKSTLLHCLAGLDMLTSGHVYVGETHLWSLGDRRLTRLRRDRIGFIFQAFNLLPTLTAAENITLPLALAGRRPTPTGSTASWTWSGCATASTTARPSCRRPAAAGRGCPGVSHQARDRLRRRAHRQPRLPHRHEAADVHAPRRGRVRADHRDGHP